MDAERMYNEIDRQERILLKEVGKVLGGKVSPATLQEVIDTIMCRFDDMKSYCER